MLDVSGQNADEFFEDIGHSNEARKELKKYYIGDFKMDEKALEALRIAAEKKKLAKQSSGSIGLILIVVIAIAAVLYRFLQK